MPFLTDRKTKPQYAVIPMDWPMRYNDLAPWYDKVEKLIGVHGDNSGIANAPECTAP